MTTIIFNKIPKFMQVLINEYKNDMHLFCKEFNISKIAIGISV
jgi:hypothetical protein